MVFTKDIGGMYDVALKPKLLLSLLREYVPDEKHPFPNPSDLSFIVKTIKTHKLLLESGPVEQEMMDGWKKAVDSWDCRVRSLLGSNMPTEKCWAGISLRGVTCQECSSERFLASYLSWLNELLYHIQLPAASPFVKVAAFAALSDLFTRLSRFPKAKKDGTSLASKVIQPTLKMLNANSSDDEQAPLSLLCTLMNFFPASIHRYYDGVEAAIVSKIMSGKCSASVLKKLSYGLSLLLKSRGDERSWLVMIERMNSHLNDAFQGLEEDSRRNEAMRVLLSLGKESPAPLGGLVVPEQTSNLSTRRPERLLGSIICALMSCCSMMLTSFYPVEVPVPIHGLLALARRVLLLDGSLSQTSFSFMSTLKQEFICSDLPLLQFHTLEIVTAVIKGLSSQVLPHVADIVRLLTEYMRRCTFPELRVRIYSIMKVLLMSMGVGTAIHMIQDVINIVSVDLDPLDYKKDDTSSKASPEVLTKSRRKRKKHSSMTGSFQEQPVKDVVEVEMTQGSIPITVKIAALEVLEALLSMGGSLKSDSWRPNVDRLLITVATNACKGGLSKEERNAFVSGECSLVWADFQLASLRVLYVSLLSPGHTCPSHLASGLELFRSGIQERGNKLTDYCEHALKVLIHSRIHPLFDTNLSTHDYKGPGHMFPDTSYAAGHSQLSTFQVGIRGKAPSEPESEDDDLNEKWVGSDDDMEIQVTETQKNANLGTSAPIVFEEKDLDMSAGNPTEKIVVGGDDNAVESPISKNTKKTKKRRRDSSPSASANLLIGDRSDVVTSEHTAFKPVGQEITDISDFGNGTSAKDEMKPSTTSKHVSETNNDNLSPIIERISASLSRSDKSIGLMLESDDESADSPIPDIVDGDPDSD